MGSVQRNSHIQTDSQIGVLLAVLRCKVNGLNTNDALFSTMVANVFCICR